VKGKKDINKTIDDKEGGRSKGYLEEITDNSIRTIVEQKGRGRRGFIKAEK
jgi:hypothetical protein